MELVVVELARRHLVAAGAAVVVWRAAAVGSAPQVDLSSRSLGTQARQDFYRRSRVPAAVGIVGAIAALEVGRVAQAVSRCNSLPPVEVRSVTQASRPQDSRSAEVHLAHIADSVTSHGAVAAKAVPLPQQFVT